MKMKLLSSQQLLVFSLCLCLINCSPFPKPVQDKRSVPLINGYIFIPLGYTIILPVSMAANFFQELWTDVYREANTKLHQASQDEKFEVSLGLVTASFDSLDGPLDWPTIIAFAAKTTNDLRRGQSGLMRAPLQNKVTNAVIGIT